MPARPPTSRRHRPPGPVVSAWKCPSRLDLPTIGKKDHASRTSTQPRSHRSVRQPYVAPGPATCGPVDLLLDLVRTTRRAAALDQDERVGRREHHLVRLPGMTSDL